jgi:hypothetical protein
MTEARFPEGVQRIYRWLEEQGRIKNSDEDPYDDRVIAAWERCGAALEQQLAEKERQT